LLFVLLVFVENWPVKFSCIETVQMVCEKFAVSCGRYCWETVLNTICYGRLAFWQYYALSVIHSSSNLKQPNIHVPN